MKKFSMFFTSLVLLCTYLSINVFALTVTPAYNASTGDITLSGNAEGIVSVRITPDAMSDGAVSVDNLPVVFYQFEADGEYNVSLRMPSSNRTGKYTLLVTDDNDSSRNSIICYDKALADALVDSAAALDEDKFIEIMTNEENIKKLGIDISDIDYSPNIVSIMAKLYDDYDDSADFVEKYNYCKALNSLLGKNRSELEENLFKYKSILKFDYDALYENNALLTNDIKENLCILLSKMDYVANIAYAEELTEKSGFEAYFSASSALAGAKTYENWSGLEKLYTKDYSFLKTKVVDTNTDYIICEPSTVFAELSKQSFDDISDLGQNFNIAVALAKSGTKPSQSSGGVSGGGSSVSVGGGSYGGTSYETLPNESQDLGKTSYSLPELKDGIAKFKDVKDNEWFFKAVSVLSASDIVNGYEDGSFKPFYNITRAEFTKLVSSAFSIIGKNGTSFEDVSKDEWYFECINSASSVGIISGYDGKFNPQNYITRQDAAVIMGRVAKLFDIEYAGYKAFDDMKDVSLYAVTTVAAFYSNGILNGDGQGIFAPLENITRAEASQLIYNLVSDMNQKS